MGLRFYKSIRLLPFVRLNISRSGFSVSLGAPGASINLGSRGARGSVGLPGTGLSYRKSLLGGQTPAWRKFWGAFGRLFLAAALLGAGWYVYGRIAA